MSSLGGVWHSGTDLHPRPDTVLVVLAHGVRFVNGLNLSLVDIIPGVGNASAYMDY